MTYPYARFEPPRPPRRSSWAQAVAIGVPIGFVLVIAVAYFIFGAPDGGRSTVYTGTQLQAASTACGGAGQLSDANRTLVLDTAGKDYSSGGSATVDDVACVLAELGAPRSVTARMESTRALDGMQTATWDHYKVSWTYHPDDGLDLIITEVGWPG